MNRGEILAKIALATTFDELEAINKLIDELSNDPLSIGPLVFASAAKANDLRFKALEERVAKLELEKTLGV